MTMPKFDPVARLITVSLPDCDTVWARTFDEYSQELSSSNPFVTGDESPLYTADQLAEAYEAGKLEQAAQIEMMRVALTDASNRFRTELFMQYAADAASALAATHDQALEQFAERVRGQCIDVCYEVGPKEYPNKLITDGYVEAIRAIKELP